ncbi:hypothetical protein J437_LFUL017375 [Ladona fulva]|uniref:Serum response factor-binding protein 1 n=1 Tax=Ladona fulva TaxID=123851 RepID=A0A8K0P8J0_LADFU|nr:hypothetical protein J437_LFUL017375 [Ladona fulva]
MCERTQEEKDLKNYDCSFKIPRMIDKLTLNNEIVLMRKVVRQARVHVIAKLIREIKKLRASKGDDALKAKCNRKAERKVEVLMVLKKLKPDVVSKFALKNTENAAEKIADPNTEIEERALFRLISSKVLAERVNQFRSKYPDWKEFICEMLDEIGANRKKNSDKPDKIINNKTNLGRTQKVEGSANKFNGIKKSSSKSLEKSHIGSNAVKVPEVDMKSKFNVGWTIKDIEPMKKFISIKTVKEMVKSEDETKEQKKLLSTHDRSMSHRSSWSVSENKKKKGAAEIRKFSELVSEDDEFPVKEETLGEPEGAEAIQVEEEINLEEVEGSLEEVLANLEEVPVNLEEEGDSLEEGVNSAGKEEATKTEGRDEIQ